MTKNLCGTNCSLFSLSIISHTLTVNGGSFLTSYYTFILILLLFIFILFFSLILFLCISRFNFSAYVLFYYNKSVTSQKLCSWERQRANFKHTVMSLSRNFETTFIRFVASFFLRFFLFFVEQLCWFNMKIRRRSRLIFIEQCVENSNVNNLACQFRY